MISIFYYKSMK